MDKAKQRIIERKRRAARVREKIIGTPERPRLCVRRSLNHIYAQIIDDTKGLSLVQVSSKGKDCLDRCGEKHLNKIEKSKIVGQIIAEKALAKGISKVVFDRKGYLFHGRVKALADAAREKGLIF